MIDMDKDLYIGEYQNKDEYVNYVKSLKEGKKTWLEHLDNLKYIKSEAKLLEN